MAWRRGGTGPALPRRRKSLPALLLAAAVLSTSAVGTSADRADEAQCLALALYWESKGEGREGMEAVGSVVLNRMARPEFPDSPCAVIQEGGETPPCQFAFWCDGEPEDPVEPEAWALAQQVAEELLAEKIEDATGGATHFHALSVEPDWAAEKERTVQIAEHVYYR